MDARTYLKVSSVNLLFLVGGLVIGTRFPNRMVTAHAQQAFEEINPGVRTGSMAIGTLVAGRIAADSIQVQGIDLLKLHENSINYLARTMGSTQGWQGVIADSKVDRPLRMAQPPPVKPEPPKPENQEKKQ